MVERKVVRLGGIDYEVRPMEGVLQGYEVWRGDDELGFFTLGASAEIDVSSHTGVQVEDVVIRLVAEKYVEPPPRQR